MKYAIVENGKVANIAVSDAPLANNWVASETAKIGDEWDGTSFTTPPLPTQPAPTLEEQKAARAEAYRNEADPIFFKSQRGEAEITEWEAKIEEIRTRYPYPAADVI